MKKHSETVLISYTDCSVQEERRGTNNQVKDSAIFPSNAPKLDILFNPNKKKIELPSTQRIPFLLGQWQRASSTTFRRRKNYVEQNFLREFFLGLAFKYPIIGLFVICKHRIYWGQLSIFALCYFAIFLTIGIIYYLLLLTTILTWATITLGPLGMLIIHIQWILQTNALTSIVCRNIILTHINNNIFDITLCLYGQKKFLRAAKYIRNPTNKHPDMHWSTPAFWMISLPTLITTSLRKSLIFATLTAISIIPIIGPTLTNQLISGRRAFSYMSRFFTLQGYDKDEAKDFEYKHLGLFLSFGMTAGFLELIPFFSILTITSNTVGAARWSVDLIKSM